MKAVKFICQNEPDPRTYIQSLTSVVDDRNHISIHWEWPNDNRIKMVVVFRVCTGEESLDELLSIDENPTIITKGMDGFYNKPLESYKSVFKLYPACFGDCGELLILNQLLGNITDILYAKMPVYYSIAYKGLPFSPLQKVLIRVEIPVQASYMPVLSVQDLLLYEKITGNHSIRYPLDEAALKNGLTLYIKKNEKIYIKPKALYENTVSLHKEL